MKLNKDWMQYRRAKKILNDGQLRYLIDNQRRVVESAVYVVLSILVAVAIIIWAILTAWQKY